MGNKIVTMVTTFIILLVFMLMISFITTDIQANETERLISEFTETARYNGYITLEQYSRLISKIPYKNIKLNITHKVSNSDIEYDTDQYANALNALDLRFTSQILGSSDSSANEQEQKGYKLYTLSNSTVVYSGTLLGNGKAEANEIVDSHIYKMRVGDELQIDLVTFEKSFFDVIASALTGADNFEMKVIASASGVVLNEKY